ncbi:MAG: hypothetical protein LBH98_04975 [Chitinispirillales bacterium]|jgi:hypothetical protein|nr:hypothetical protein [Chitinispirillales bacterium]
MKRLFLCVFSILVFFTSCEKKKEAELMVNKSVQDISGITDIRQGRQMIDKLNKSIEIGNNKLLDAEEGVE